MSTENLQQLEEANYPWIIKGNGNLYNCDTIPSCARVGSCNKTHGAKVVNPLSTYTPDDPDPEQPDPPPYTPPTKPPARNYQKSKRFTRFFLIISLLLNICLCGYFSSFDNFSTLEQVEQAIAMKEGKQQQPTQPPEPPAPPPPVSPSIPDPDYERMVETIRNAQLALQQGDLSVLEKARGEVEDEKRRLNMKEPRNDAQIFELDKYLRKLRIRKQYRNVKFKGWLPGEEILSAFQYLPHSSSSECRVSILTTMGRTVDYELDRAWRAHIVPQLEGEPIELSEEYMLIAEIYPRNLVGRESEKIDFFKNLVNIFREYH